MKKADDNSNESSVTTTPESDLRSEPGLWEVLGAVKDVPVSSGFSSRVGQAVLGTRGRRLLFRRLIPVTVAAGVLILAAWWLSRSEESTTRALPHSDIPELTVSELEALLDDGSDEDEHLAKEVDGLSVENREWFGG